MAVAEAICATAMLRDRREEGGFRAESRLIQRDLITAALSDLSVALRACRGAAGIDAADCRHMRIRTIPSRHSNREASTCSDPMASTVLRRWCPGATVPAGLSGSC